MLSLKLFTRLSNCLTLLLVMGLFTTAKAQIISTTAQEVMFYYIAHFEVPMHTEETTDEERALQHASHLFGLFQTSKMIHDFKVPAYLVAGIGAPSSQMKINIISAEMKNGKYYYTYENSGKMILHNNAAKLALKNGYMDIPLPVDPYAIYNVNCTDEHYNSFGDYWYFYNPFKKDCEYLSEMPMSEMVRITISPTFAKKIDRTPKLPMLRGNNKNGSLFLIYAIHGYETKPGREDAGQINYKEFNSYLKLNGFVEDRTKKSSLNPMNIYTKEIKLENGQRVHVEVRHLLTATDIDSNSRVFAKFFKEAVETADVILYGGHSGLGGNLDLVQLQEKAGAFNFNKDKKQIFFFDSCSSYSYYLESFAAEKTKAKIDVLSYGLSSYFHTSNVVWAALMNRLLAPETKDVTWKEILSDMEEVLEGESYLLNVGGI